MQNALKLFGAKATASFNEHFRNSLWKLTILYTVVIATILVVSSGVIYSAFSQKLGRRYQDFRLIPQNRPLGFEIVRATIPTQAEVQEELIYSLILVNGILIIIAGIASYWLAHITLRPVKESYDAQRRFFADASHELRTPLSILKIELENELAKNAVPVTQQEKIRSHLEEVDRMSTLVSDLLVLSRLHDQDNKTNVQRFTINLSAMVRDIHKRLQPLASQHIVHMTLHEANSDITISSDEQALSRAILNVIKNAIIYNKPDGMVTITVSTKEKKALVEIVDTGIGVSPDDLTHIFERFYRADKSRSRASGGSGLGLSITRSSLEQLDGSVDVKSTLEQGTTVTLTLPV
ncbi:MAG: ATP-binding protein [bacterium]|nr:ATP-binding protein [bacterium]